MLNNYVDSGGGFNNNHGQSARPTEPQKQQNLGTSWSYNSQLEGMYYGGEHQPTYMGPYDGSTKHGGYPQYPSGTLHQPVPTPVVQCQEACCQHYENRYPINPAPLRYQPSGTVQPRYPEIPTNDSRQYFPDRRSLPVNLPRKKMYPAENSYAGISDRHYSQYMGRSQTLPVDSRQQMPVVRPQYPMYPHYWSGSRGWAGARMNCPPPSYHQAVNQSAQLQPGAKMSEISQYVDPSHQKTLNNQHQRAGGSGSGKLDIIRPIPEPKRSALDASFQNCYEYGYPPGFLPFSEVNKIQGKSLNPQGMNAACKLPGEKQFHHTQMQYPYQNNERNLINYGNPSIEPSYSMNFPLPSNDIHARPILDEGQQVSDQRKLAMQYDSASNKKRQELDVRQFLSTWDDDEDDCARLSEPPIPVSSSTTPYIVVDCKTLESEAAAKLQDRFKPSSQDCSTKPRNISPNSELKHSNEQHRQEENSEKAIIHSDLHAQTIYAPSMPTLLSDSDKSVNFWNGTNKEGDGIGKGGAFQPLDCSKRDSSIDSKLVTQRDSLPPRDTSAHKVLCNGDPTPSFDALVSFYGDNRRASGGYDLVEMSERLMNSSDKSRIELQPSAELARPCDPRLQQSQHSNNPSMYNKISPRYSANSYQHFKGMPSDPYYNYKQSMTLGEKYYSYENATIGNSNYDYKFASEFENARIYEKDSPKDSRRILFPENQKVSENSILEPLQKSSLHCFQEKSTADYRSMEPEQFISPIIVKATDNHSEPCTLKNNVVENRLSVLNSSSESNAHPEKTVLVTSQNGPPEMFSMPPFSPGKEMAHKDNVVTLHSGDQTKTNTITVEVPYVQQYSTLVKLSEEISRTENVDGTEEKTVELSEKSTEEVKKPTCFKFKRLPNSEEWTVEGKENTESDLKEVLNSPESSEMVEDNDILKTSVSVSNLNMPSLDDIRDGEENCEVIENLSKTKGNEGVLCSTKLSTSQPPQLAIVQPMKLVQNKESSPEPNLQNDINITEGKTVQSVKSFKSFQNLSLNRANFINEKSLITSERNSATNKVDISKHENFRSHKKIQGDFSNSFSNCLTSNNISQEVSSETSVQQYSPFHMYTDCEVSSQIPTSPGVDGMFEDINHSTNQLCHNQIYQRNSCNFQDLESSNMTSFDNHNTHFQSFSSMFTTDDTHNKGRCDGSILQMGDKKYLKNLFDDIERQQVSNTLEERVSKLKSNFMNERSNEITCKEKKSPPIPPISLKLNESKKVWCITNKDQHLSLVDCAENASSDLTSSSATCEKIITKNNETNEYTMEIPFKESNQNNYVESQSSSKNGDETKLSNEIEKEPAVEQLMSESNDDMQTSSEQSFIETDLNSTLASKASSLDILHHGKIVSGCSISFGVDFNANTKEDLTHSSNKKENHCRSLVKYFPKCKKLIKSLCHKVGNNISPSILILDENGTHFPNESIDETTKFFESKFIAMDIVDLLVSNVISCREVGENLESKALDSRIKYSNQEMSENKRENLETVIKFDKTSKSEFEKDGITKTTEIFIQHEKEHNHLSVIKATQHEKYLFSLNDHKGSFRSIFSPVHFDGKDNSCLNTHCVTTVEKIAVDERMLNLKPANYEKKTNRMDVDLENYDNNQPLDYSFNDSVNNQDSVSCKDSVCTNLASTLCSNDESNAQMIGCKMLNEVEDIKCCSYDLSENNHQTENSNSKSVSIEKNKSNLLIEQIKITKPMTEKNSNECGNGEVDECFLSDKIDIASDFYMSDSESINDKESTIKEAEHFTEQNVNVGTDSSLVIRKDVPQTLDCVNEKGSVNIYESKPLETIEGQVSKVNELSDENLCTVKSSLPSDNPAKEYFEPNNKPSNEEDNSSNEESVLDENSLKNVVTFTDELSICTFSKDMSKGNESKYLKMESAFKSFNKKADRVLTNPISTNIPAKNSLISMFQTEERLETSVIVRNSSCASNNNDCYKEYDSVFTDDTETNVNKNCDLSTEKSVKINKKTDIEPHLYKNLQSEATEVDSLNSGLSHKSKVGAIETEYASSTQTSVITSTEFNNEYAPIMPAIFEKESCKSKLCYCVSESIFLNIDEECMFDLKKSNSSYLFDFKKRKLLKFYKYINRSHLSLSGTDENNQRDSSLINDGIDANENMFSSSLNISKKAFPKSEVSLYNGAKAENPLKTTELDDVVHSQTTPENKDSISNQLNWPVIIKESVPIQGTYNMNNKYQMYMGVESKGYQAEEDVSVIKSSKNVTPLKRKISLTQETVFCIRRDSLKILEPEAVLKEIFSPDTEHEDLESKENYLSIHLSKDKQSCPNDVEKLNLTTLQSELLVERNRTKINSFQNLADKNYGVLSSIGQDKPLVSTNLGLCIPYTNSETKTINYVEDSKNNNEAKQTMQTPTKINTKEIVNHNTSSKHNFSSVGTDVDSKPLEKNIQHFIAPSLHDSNDIEVSCRGVSQNDKCTDFNNSITDNFNHLINSHEMALSLCSISLHSSDKKSKKVGYEKECEETTSKNVERRLSTEEELRTTESLTAQDLQSCHLSNLDSHVNHTVDDEKSVSTMAIVTGKDVLFSSRFLEGDDEKEGNSDFHSGCRSRKSSVEEESILDCQSLKANPQDTLRAGSHLSTETFPLQCLVEAALALENVDSKQMLMNSSSFSGVYSQSSQTFMKSSIEDVHPNDIEDFTQKNPLSISHTNLSNNNENKLLAGGKEIFSKLEENNYNLRASTKIVTSSSSNIIPYSKRYYGLKRQKLTKSPQRKKKSETSIEKGKTKKRKDVFTYPRSKRRKKVAKEKSKYQPLKILHGSQNKSSENSIQNTSYDFVHDFDNQGLILDKESFVNNNKIEEKENKCLQSHIINRPEDYDTSSDLTTSEKLNFGGPLIIANENCTSDSNIFCVHVNSDKMDEYVHDLNVGGLELLSDNNASVFKDNPIEERSDPPDVTLENGTSLVIIIEDLDVNEEKSNFYNSCKSNSDAVLDSVEDRNPLLQPNSILDYCSDNETPGVSVNGSCVCPSNFGESNSENIVFNSTEISKPNHSLAKKGFAIGIDKLEVNEKLSDEYNRQELLTTNCYEEINETLVNDIGNWPFVEEEVAEFDSKSVSPNGIPEEGRKIELKCSLPWVKIFNMTKTKKKKNKTSPKVSGLELGPAKVEVRLRAPSTEWKVISDYAENSSPVVKVSRLILQRDSETSSYSEKDSEEENENRKLLSPSPVTSESKNNSDLTMCLIEDEKWQPIVLLTRDKELDELTLLNTREKDSGEITPLRVEGNKSDTSTPTLDEPFQDLSDFSSQNNNKRDFAYSDSDNKLREKNEYDLENSNQNENSNEKVQNSFNSNLTPERNDNVKYSKSEKGCSYEKYSPSGHNSSLAEEVIYSPSDPHYSPDPGFPHSEGSYVEDKKKSPANENDSSHCDVSRPTNFRCFDMFNNNSENQHKSTKKSSLFENYNSLFDVDSKNVNLHASETSDTNCSSETITTCLFEKSRDCLLEHANSLPLGNLGHTNSHYAQSEESGKSNLKRSLVEENLRKFKRKMPKNFFVRRKSKKQLDAEIILDDNKPVEKQDGHNPVYASNAPDENSFECSNDLTSNSSDANSILNEWQARELLNPIEERLKNTKTDPSFVYENSRLPSLDNLQDSSVVRINDPPLAEKFEEKLRLRDSGRGLKRPCEGHSKEDTKRRRKSSKNHSNKCFECDVQFESKDELTRHEAQEHAASRELHHCLLCRRSFSSGARYRLHKQGRSHNHLVLTQRHTIHAVHRLLTGRECPRIPPLSSSEQQDLQWRPSQPGYSHVYHQLTPLHTLLQEHGLEVDGNMAAEERRQQTPND